MIENSLKILIIASWYKDEKSPMTGSFIEEQAQMLSNRGHEVVILHAFLKGTFFNTLNERDDQIERYYENGIQIVKLGVAPVFPKARHFSYQKLCIKSFNTLNKLNIQNFDLIHSHAMFMGGIVGEYLANKWNIPFFHTEHTSGFIFDQNQYTKRDKVFIKKVIAASERTIFVSTFALSQFESWIGSSSKLVVLPNVVSPVFFNSPIESLDFEKIKVCMICNLKKVKNVELSIHSIAKINSDNVELSIFGEGPQKKHLESLIQSLNLGNQVRLYTSLDRSEVVEVIQENHLLISTSIVETFGLTVAEAQALGKPVVVTDSGGVRDIVDNDTGIICNSNAEEIAKAIVWVKNNYNTFSSNVIRAKTKVKFGQEEIYSRLILYYKEALNLTS